LLKPSFPSAGTWIQQGENHQVVLQPEHPDYGVAWPVKLYKNIEMFAEEDWGKRVYKCELDVFETKDKLEALDHVNRNHLIVFHEALVEKLGLDSTPTGDVLETILQKEHAEDFTAEYVLNPRNLVAEQDEGGKWWASKSKQEHASSMVKASFGEWKLDGIFSRKVDGIGNGSVNEDTLPLELKQALGKGTIENHPQFILAQRGNNVIKADNIKIVLNQSRSKVEYLGLGESKIDAAYESSTMLKSLVNIVTSANLWANRKSGTREVDYINAYTLLKARGPTFPFIKHFRCGKSTSPGGIEGCQHKRWESKAIRSRYEAWCKVTPVNGEYRVDLEVRFQKKDKEEVGSLVYKGSFAYRLLETEESFFYFEGFADYLLRHICEKYGFKLLYKPKSEICLVDRTGKFGPGKPVRKYEERHELYKKLVPSEVAESFKALNEEDARLVGRNPKPRPKVELVEPEKIWIPLDSGWVCRMIGEIILDRDEIGNFLKKSRITDKKRTVDSLSHSNLRKIIEKKLLDESSLVKIYQELLNFLEVKDGGKMSKNAVFGMSVLLENPEIPPSTRVLSGKVERWDEVLKSLDKQDFKKNVLKWIKWFRNS
ncbi:MAG: hypothetical protein ACFFCS_07570, partial [Candidatus Hodarchaeota archaeon]